MPDYIDMIKNAIIVGFVVGLGLMVYTPAELREDPVVDPAIKSVRCNQCPISIPKVIVISTSAMIGIVVLQLIVMFLTELDLFSKGPSSPEIVRIPASRRRFPTSRRGPGWQNPFQIE